MTNHRTHYFRNDNDDRTVVQTSLLPSGRYRAIIVEGENSELVAFGYGHSRLAAIADLNDKIESAAHVFVKDGGEL